MGNYDKENKIFNDSAKVYTYENNVKISMKTID